MIDTEDLKRAAHLLSMEPIAITTGGNGIFRSNDGQRYFLPEKSVKKLSRYYGVCQIYHNNDEIEEDIY